ncbi:MAG: hypothetical protein BM557_01335 [Flavobacterium sp. MedPE-SWcel]|uniref:hypothetical protein n=1 Tax=uncultured Flavobacterium sp. TaxID=165435 RepID=UPI0009128A7E|nr:hypothetical protein [uncultured Flavobacterium sp.]OIQ22049.1 MAG: hypothetical protein BM557_01335 [Flavobacterium sp. MedPE-SWcel]
MHSIEIPEAALKLFIPENLAECERDQYLDMCALLYQVATGSISFEQMKVQAVYRLLNIVPGRKHDDTFDDMDEHQKWDNVTQLSILVDSFFTDDNGQKVIRQDYTHNPVPKIRPLLKNYFGPADSFTNVTFGEYNDGLRLFLEYSTTGEYEKLYLLAAIFYRPKKKWLWLERKKVDYNGDVREQYNANSIASRAAKIKQYHPGFAYGFYLLFASFQKCLTQAVIPWGNRELDLSILFDADAAGESDDEAVPGIGMDSLAYAIAESGEFGTIEDVRNTNLWEVLIRLYDLKKKDLDYKQNEKDNAIN